MSGTTLPDTRCYKTTPCSPWYQCQLYTSVCWKGLGEVDKRRNQADKIFTKRNITILITWLEFMWWPPYYSRTCHVIFHCSLIYYLSILSLILFFLSKATLIARKTKLLALTALRRFLHPISYFIQPTLSAKLVAQRLVLIVRLPVATAYLHWSVWSGSTVWKWENYGKIWAPALHLPLVWKGLKGLSTLSTSARRASSVTTSLW